MEVNELRIGNYVKFYDPINGTNIYKVYRINDSGSVSLEDKGQLASCTVKNIEPIELTGDILIMTGFFKRSNREIYFITPCIGYYESCSYSFSFPTEKMAEEFLKCFKDLFEQCKNLI